MNQPALIFDTSLGQFQQDVIEASFQLPLLVDFWAEWCAPCITIAPVLKQVIPRYEGAIRLAKLEVDEGDNMKLAGQHQVKGFPTIMLFRDGQEVARFSGMRSSPMIEQFIANHTGLEPTA